MSKAMKPELFIDLTQIINRQFFEVDDIFHLFGDSLKSRLKQFLKNLEVRDQPKILGHVHPQSIIEGEVYIAEGAKVGPFCYIQGPTYIGPQAEVRHGAFIRGNAYIGKKAVVGHTTEIKGAVFLDEAKAGHFAYVGDSLLGRNVNLGAGTKLANLKLKGNEVKVIHPTTKELLNSGLRKLGSILGDDSQTGCNAVLSPGTILMPHTAVLPCVHFLGTLEKGFAR